VALSRDDDPRSGLPECSLLPGERNQAWPHLRITPARSSAGGL